MVSGAGAFDFAVSAGRCRAGCGLCWLWLEGWRLCPLCFALLAVRPVGRGSCLLAVACGGRCWLCLWPGGCAPGGWCCAAVLLEAVRLEAVRLCCDLLAACLLAVRFTRRPRPLLAVWLCPMAWRPPPWWAVLPEGWRLAAIVGRRSYRPPVPLEGGRLPVLCFWLAACLPVCWSWPPPRNAPRKTPGKRRENFQRFFRRGIFRARSKSCYLVY